MVKQRMNEMKYIHRFRLIIDLITSLAVGLLILSPYILYIFTINWVFLVMEVIVIFVIFGLFYFQVSLDKKYVKSVLKKIITGIILVPTGVFLIYHGFDVWIWHLQKSLYDYQFIISPNAKFVSTMYDCYSAILIAIGMFLIGFVGFIFIKDAEIDKEGW